MDDFLSKPVQFEALNAVLAKWTLHQARTLQAAERRAPKDERPLLQSDMVRSNKLEQLFIQHARLDLQQLREALAACDSAVARTKAHRIKGSALTFGASRLSDQAARIEAELKRGREVELARVEQLDVTLERTIECLQGTK